MKRIGSFSLAIIVFTLSIVLCFPDISFADDATTLSKSKDNPFGYSSSEAQSYVSAHKDIYDSDHILLFSYTPTNTYNWTYSQVGKNSLHLSDNQLVAFLMSKKTITAYASMFVSVLSNNNVTRGLLSSVGIATTGDSDSLVNVMDKLTGNYNYLDALNYDEDSQTITMSNDNGSVDKLRQEIQDYYYKSLGVCLIKSSGKPSDGVYQIRSTYDDQDEYNHDLTAANDFDYAFFTSTTDVSDAYTLAMFNKKDISYLYAQIDTSSYFSHCYSLMFSDDGVSSFYLFSKMKYFYNYYNTADLGDYYSNYYYTQDSFVGYGIDMRNLPYISSIYPCYIKGKDYANNPTATRIYKLYRHADYFASAFYSKDGSPLVVFKSQSALYNYIQGDQSAYLTKTINDTGKDISYSIKNMDENLGSKLDTLIDTINEDKKTMSASELQDAIDKGLEELNKNTEDIKDNTSSILDKLEEQNQILLQILGVTEYIAYQTTKDDGSSYTKTDLTNTINKIYNGLGNAILYGKNTLTDSGDSSGAASQSSIVTREDFKLSNNIYTSSGSGVSPGTPVVAYSLDDYSVYDDSNDYDVGIASQDINNMDIHDGMFGKFPFSVPYQLYEWLQVLQADPVAPKLVYNYGFLLGLKDDQKYDLVIDFNIYESWANVCKSFLRLSFTLAMSLFLYKKFKGNSIF